MILTRRDFFDAAVDILYRKGNSEKISYIDSIEYAKDELGISDNELKKLLMTGVNEIYIRR